jgi:sigma-B regulation protein RsbU (phosphoserine phosphatase)
LKLRTTMFVWVLGLVVVLLGATTGTIFYVLDGSTRARVAEDLARARVVTTDLHANRESLNRQECRVVAEEPRVRAVVATEDVARETILDAVRTLAQTLGAGVFVIVDPDARLIADNAAPDAEGFSLADRPVVAKALANGEQSGVWLADGKAFLVQGCRLEFGARVVGALVIGHAIDDDFTKTVSRQTGGDLVVISDRAALTQLPPGTATGELGSALDEVRAGAREVVLGGTHFYAQLLAMPGYQGEHRVEYLLLRSIDEALAPARRVVRILFALVGAAALATLVLAFGLSRRLSRPIDQLVVRTQAIAHGDLSPHPIKTGPTEVRDLGAAMDRMATELDESRQALADKERLARELEIAARIQTSILPRNFAVPGLDIAARMMTATEVGGDYYDVLPMEDGCWIAVGDASGHGLTAGLVMMMVQTGVATLVRHAETHPKDVLRTLNRVVFENIHDRLEAERHMTLSLMRYRTDGQIVVAGAHMDAVVWRAATSKIDLLGTPGTFLAITEDIDQVNVEKQWKLERGDLLVLLTDGVTEAEDAGGKPFGYEGVTAVIDAVATRPVAAVRDALFDAVKRHSPSPADDVTILVLRFVGPGETS